MNKVEEIIDRYGYKSVNEMEKELIKDIVSISDVMVEINLYLTRNNIYRIRVLNSILDSGYWIYSITTDGAFYSLEYYKDYKQAMKVISKIIKTGGLDL